MAIQYKQRKKYSRPRKMFDAARIAEENELVKKYGLKNKREIWKADAVIKKIRERAKSLITAPTSEQEKFISNLAEKGFLKKNSQLDDVLDLKMESILDRRLQTIVFRKGLAKTVREARQAVVHRHILVGDHVINIPSFSVNLKQEEIIRLKEKPKVKKQEKAALVEEKAEVKTEGAENA